MFSSHFYYCATVVYHWYEKQPRRYYISKCKTKWSKKKQRMLMDPQQSDGEDSSVRPGHPHAVLKTYGLSSKVPRELTSCCWFNDGVQVEPPCQCGEIVET